MMVSHVLGILMTLVNVRSWQAHVRIAGRYTSEEYVCNYVLTRVQRLAGLFPI